MIGTVEPVLASQVAASKRIKGTAKQAALKKRPTKQAPALKVRVVFRLHEILQDPFGSYFDRFAAGAILFSIYGRCRVSNLRHVQKIIADFSPDGKHGFVEVLTEYHKTAQKDKKRLLPIVAPAVGVTGDNWALTFINLRSQSFPEGKQGPLLPAPKDISAKAFTSRPIHSDEVTDILKLFLQSFPEAPELTSHSCKETVLSWMAKVGAEKNVLDFLGRHVGTITSSDIYARGAQSRPLRKLNMMLNQIRLGTFDPDSTRSGQFVPQDRAVPIEVPETVATSREQQTEAAPCEEFSSPTSDEEAMPASPPGNTDEVITTPGENEDAGLNVQSEHEDDSSSSSSTSSSESEDAPPEIPEASFNESRCFMRSKGKVHVLSAGSSDRLQCGRQRTSTYVAIEPTDAPVGSFCNRCKPDAFPIKTRADLIAAIDKALKK